MSENIALKIRFVLLGNSVVLGSSVVIEIEEQKSNLLGYSGLLENYTVNQEKIINKFLRRDVGVYVETKIPFEMFKQDLSEFADSNAFHGKDKPVPRIEHHDISHYKLTDRNGQFSIVDCKTVAIMVKECEAKLPTYYEVKPKFTHEWKKVYPREIKPSDFEMIPVNHACASADYRGNTILELNQICEKISQIISQSDIEIWEFTVWSDEQ
jgi:hypothetical protein